jgi:methionyl-tRNA formyltransferase
VEPEETAGELEPRLARLGAQVLLDTLIGLSAGTIRPTPQDPQLATYAPLIRKEDGQLDWTRPADALARRIRAFHPWPGTHTRLAGRGLKVLHARAEPGPSRGAEPGVVLSTDRSGVIVACGEGTALLLLEVQPESRRAMDAASFAAGARLAVGARFDS